MNANATPPGVVSRGGAGRLKTEIDLGVLLLLGHLAAEGVKVRAHRLVVEVVPDDGEDRQAVAHHGPEARGAVHHGAVAEATHDRAIRSPELRPDGRADAIAERGAEGADEAPLALVESERHEVVSVAETLGRHHRALGQHRARHMREVVGVK